jgi:cell division protein FtsB
MPADGTGPAAGRAGVFGRRAARADVRADLDDRLENQSSSRPKLTSRAAVLVVVICAIALSLAYPIREYIAERRQIDQLQVENAQLATKVQKLRTEQRAVTSPAFIEQAARDRLHMCFPAQTCYVVIAPVKRHGEIVPSDPVTPWYGALWASVRTADGTPPKLSR